MNRSLLKVAAIFLFGLALAGLTLVLTGCASDQEKKAQLLSESQAFFESGEYNKAIIQLKNILKLDPNSAEAYSLMAKAHLKLGDAQQGFNALLRLEQITPDDLDTVTQVASFYLLAQQIEEAQQRVDRVLKDNPDHIAALFLKAGILSRDKANLARIGDIYEQILKIDANQPRAHLALSRVYSARSEHKNAEKSLRAALALEPENTQIYKTLFGFYLSRNDAASAESVLADLIAKKPDDTEPYIFLGNFHLGRGDLKKAENAFLTAMDKDPENLTPYMLLAKVLNRQDKKAEAEGFILKALDHDPENYAVKNAYAEFHFHHKDLAKADELASEILSKRPDFLPAKILKGKILTENKEYNKAATIFRELIRDEPDSAMYHYLLGSVLAKDGETSQAKSVLSTAVEKDPKLFQARLLLANIHYRQGDIYLAEDNVKQVLRQIPDHYNANILMGNILMANKETDRARAIFKRFIQQQPQNPTAYFRLGVLERTEGRFDLAAQNLNRALDINPGLMDVFSSLVAVYAVQKKYDTGIRICDAHLAKQGDDPMVAAIILNLKGNLLLASNQRDAAKKAFSDSIDNNPKYITPYLTLAKVLTSQGKIDETIALYRRLIENRPDQPAPYALLGTIYEQQGDTDQAETLYKKSLEVDPDHIPAVNNLAFLYAEQDRQLNEALDLARQAKERLGRVPAVMDTLGWVYYKKELYDSALMEFEACVEKDPDNPVFRYHLGLTLHKLGRLSDAEKSLKKALDLQKDFKGADQARQILDSL